MELRACLEALNFIKNKKLQFQNGDTARLYSDSQYVVDGSKSIIYWRKNSWKLSSGDTPLNLDLWKEMIKLLEHLKYNVGIEKVKGKSTDMLKEVDKLAKKAARSPGYIDFGYNPGTTARSINQNKKPAEPLTLFDKEIAVRFYRKRCIDLKQNLWQGYFEIYSTEQSSYIDKKQALLTVMPHRAKCYKAVGRLVLGKPYLELTSEIACP